MHICETCGREFNTGYGTLIRHMTSHRHDNVKLTDFQKQVILGSLLGDMSIIIPHHNINPRLSITHSIKQAEYLMWKYHILENLVGSKPKTIFCGGGMGKGKIYETIFFSSLSLPCLLPIHNLVRGVGSKYISPFWLNEITDPIALAVWYMDDGCLGINYILFSLGIKSQEECSTLQNWMINEWDIDSSIYEQRQKGRVNIYKNLVLSKPNAIKFKNLVDPYIISSMRYKIDAIG